jgi:GAF domain-containing protein
MHELTLLESGPAGATFSLRVALAAVPCLAGLVHLRDPKTLDLVVVHAEGPRADGLVQTRTPLTDSLVARAARAGKPTVATYGAEPDAEKTSCPRHAFFDPWSVVVVPVMHGGQLLGLLEMIDPIDGNPTGEQEQGALTYIADRLGRFLADHASADD